MSARIEERDGVTRVICDDYAICIHGIADQVFILQRFDGRCNAGMQMNRNEAAQLAVALQRVLEGGK